MRKTGLAVIALLAFASHAFGQASDGNLVGTIADATGAGVPNANVTIKNAATGIQTATKTTQTGEYRFNNIAVGQYDLSAQAAGFTTARLGNLSIELNKTATVNLTLQLGAVSATVEVSEAAAAIDTTTAQVGATFE